LSGNWTWQRLEGLGPRCVAAPGAGFETGKSGRLTNPERDRIEFTIRIRCAKDEYADMRNCERTIN